jgi:hypothetical protein
MEINDTLMLISLTQTEINAITAPIEGGLIYNSTTSQVQAYNGTTWEDATGASPSGSAGGDLGGTYPNPKVTAITETSGPTSLVAGAIADGELLKRVGSTLVSFKLEIPICPFGAKSDSLGKFLIANGKSSDADDSTKPKTRQPIPISGTIIGLAYKTKDGDTTTRMKLHINGVVEETITLSSMNGNGQGREDFAGAIVDAYSDYSEIEWDGGQKPGECTMTLIIQP